MKTFLLTLSILPALLYAQTKAVNVNYMIRGYFYAGSSIIDTLAAGGFWESPNKPKTVTASFPFTAKGLQFIIDTTAITSFGKNYKGYKVYLINNSDTITAFTASDSRLSIIAEAYVHGKWQAIEYLPSSWCGNSYHHVYIQPAQYWEFDAPAYTGSIKTKLRFKLVNGASTLYSNEIIAGINKGQLKEKQGHTQQGLMDPYND